jgi:hypothetical protein
MEFEGRITDVLPARTGTRQDGTTWTDLTFVFAYYENGEQRFEDSAMVSTFDTNIMARIAPYIVRGQDGKAVVENDVVKMSVPHIPCKCGFSLKVKNVKKKDGTGYLKIQENRCYRLEIMGAQQQQPAPQQPQGSGGNGDRGDENKSANGTVLYSFNVQKGADGVYRQTN